MARSYPKGNYSILEGFSITQKDEFSVRLMFGVWCLAFGVVRV